jgi:hypothetical protein
MLFEGVEFRNRTDRWFAHLVLLMPDHLHALISFGLEWDLKKAISNHKEATAKRAGVAWQRDFFDHRLRAEDSFREKADYISMNPVRKGLVENPGQWAYIWLPGQRTGGPSGPALPPNPLRTDGGPSGPTLPPNPQRTDGGPNGPALPE